MALFTIETEGSLDHTTQEIAIRSFRSSEKVRYGLAKSEVTPWIRQNLGLMASIISDGDVIKLLSNTVDANDWMADQR